MPSTSTLLAIALVGLPIAAQAQNIQTPSAGRSRAQATVEHSVSAGARPNALQVAVRLTRRGVQRTPERTLLRGLEIVDRQQVDVDGDGDMDSLLMVDLAPDEEPKDDLGRGVVVVLRERHGYRAQTVASVPLYPMEAGYNWGPVESLRTGAAPLLHVMYSQSAGTEQHEGQTVLHWTDGALREVHTVSVASVPGSGEAAIMRTLDLQAADVDGDGVNELLERVAASSHCPESGCITADGMFNPTVTRRVLRWDATRAEFVEDAALQGYRTSALRTLDEAMTRWRAGDIAARDVGIARAYSLDPLDARVRMAFARRLLRVGEFAPALVTLQFSWPQGYGREARLLQAEAAAYSGNPDCHSYLATVRNDDPVRGAALTDRLASLSAHCRAPGGTPK